ncbi:MAG: hypothetical protein JXA24_07965 [Proteobacteria bacterium]|nr:hypothetical protein [Pseudomonadota bacterium]
MKKVKAIATAVAALALFASAASAKDVPVGKGAAVHTIVATQPADVEVVKSYDRAIKIRKLGRNDTAYWHATNGTYLLDGRHAYLWCAIYEPNKDQAKYHWVAINTEAFNRAMQLNQSFEGGVAFYLVTNDGKETQLTAYPYSTLDAMTRGEKIVNVNE